MWKGESKELDEIYTFIELRVLPKEDWLTEGIIPLREQVQRELNRGNIGLASLFNACLIELYYRLLSPSSEKNDEYLEQFLLRLNAQANYYRLLNDEYWARQTIGIIRKESKNLKDLYLKKAIEGYTDCREGTLIYRRGEYGRLLELFLREDRDIWRRRFDEAFSDARYTALDLLKNGEKKLREALDFWEQELTHTADDNERKRLEDLIKRHRKHLGEVRFRLGELLMLNGQFDEYPGEGGKQKGALSYLKEAIEDSKAGEDWYRYDDAIQSYINALYFAGRYDHPDYIEERQVYEKALEDTQQYPSIMGRLRIMQGDVLFSQHFRFQLEDKLEGRFYYYVLKEKQRVRTIRTMWCRYVEACNFMAQHSSKNFSAVVRVLERRIQLIADIPALNTICQGLPDAWNEQEHLKEKEEELTTLIQFARIRSMILGDENNK